MQLAKKNSMPLILATQKRNNSCRVVSSSAKSVFQFLIVSFSSIVFLLCSESFSAPFNSMHESAFPSLAVVESQTALKEQTFDLLFGLFMGVIITASLYLFFIWLIIRDRGQASLMFLLICIGLNMASTNDFMMSMLGIDKNSTRQLLQNYSIILSHVFSIMFTYYFLEIDVHVPKLQKPFVILIGFLLLLLAYAIFDNSLVFFALPTIGVITIFAVLSGGLSSLYHGVNGSLSHIIAFSSLLLGNTVQPLYDLGFIATPEESMQISYAFYALAALMFAIVIAIQFSARQEEKERALAISNERFALAALGSNEGLFDWNKITGEVFFSGQFRRILDTPIESNINGLKQWMKIIYPSDRKIIFAALRRFRDNLNASTITFEYRIKHKNQQWRWLHTKVVVLRNPRNGAITRYVGSIGDITARKQGEAALKASEARFRSITEAHPVPVLIARLNDNQILYASPGAENLLELPNGAIISYQLSRFLIKAEERKEIMEAMVRGHEVNLKEVTIAKGDGETIPAALSARRINYLNQAAMVIGIYDLSEKKKAEEQIAKQKEALQQSEKMAALGGLLAGVAHELNNPLSVVVGQSTLLIEGEQEIRVKNRAEKIFKAADRCSRIVKSFLALARRKPPERKLLDLNGIIHASLDLLNYQFRNENVELSLELDPDLPMVKGDPDQLTQVFTNMALNSAQALHDWQGIRRLIIRTEKADAKSVRVTVADTGPGIPQEIRNRIFEPFFTTKSGQGGTGVGLSLCLSIIESHGGKVVLEETKGGGATFIVTLPTADALEETGENNKETTPQPIEKLKILLVDDEVELAQTLADLLEPEGHEIDLAANGEIALKKIKTKHYDAIISDLRMPVMDGPALYSALSTSLPQYLDRIIYVTGDTLSPHVQKFLSQTDVPVIEKPYRLSDVHRALVAIKTGNKNLKTEKKGMNNIQ